MKKYIKITQGDFDELRSGGEIECEIEGKYELSPMFFATIIAIITIWIKM